MIPQQLKRQEFRFIKVKPKNKIPIETGWQKEKNYSFDDEELLKHVNSGGNYGVATGFGNLIVIDSDNPKTQEKVDEFLPATFQTTTGKGTHNYYICKDLKEKIVMTEDSEGNHYGEVQTVGQQVVGAGSTHPNGHKYAVKNDVPLIEIKSEQIKSALKDLMKQKREEKVRLKSTPIASNEGARNETLFKLACSFKSRGVVREEALKTLLSINTSNNPPLEQAEVETLVNSAFKYHTDFGELKVNNYLDNVEKFWAKQPFFYDKQRLFWMWNFSLHKWEIVDEVDIMNMIEDGLGFHGETVTRNVRDSYIECFKRVGRKYHPMDAPKRWIQFKDKAFSLRSNNIYDVQPNYFFCNPIPWEISNSCETPVMDKLFVEWVGEKYVKTLYEIIAYCCYSDYPIQTLFCFLGHGRNGKSQFQKLLCKFLGSDNICSTELDQLTSNRFESFKLYKKLACSMGETNFGVLKSTSLIKKLTGGDLIGFEKKNKDPFDDVNYAKIIINSNSLPSSDDTSEGFYRRWLIIDFPNQFKEGKDIIATIPEQEYDNLAKKVCNIVPLLLDNGSFTNQGDIEERQKRYIDASNPINDFLETYTEIDVLASATYNDMYKAYTLFLRNKKRRTVTRKEFTETLAQEGLFSHKTSRKNEDGDHESTLWIDNVKLDNKWKDLC